MPDTMSCVGDKLHTMLKDPGFYSRSYVTCEKEIGAENMAIAMAYVAIVYKDPVTLFCHDNVLYIGLASQKKRYDEDAKNGANRFEKGV